MHRFTFRIAVALLTFILGATAASICLWRWNRGPDGQRPAPLSSNGRSQDDDVTREANGLKEVLSDFSFIEEGAYAPDSIPSHGMEPKPLPTTFENGRQYIFHRRYNDSLFTELQGRIRSQGFEILATDRIASRYVGGLLFRIKFRNAERQFTILNEPDLYILANSGKYRNLSVDDYVLVIGSTDSR
jgi:hypothetical protein